MTVKGLHFGTIESSISTGRIASENDVGSIELRLHGLESPLIGICDASGTCGWQNEANSTCKVGRVSGMHDPYFRFVGGDGELFNADWWKLERPSGSEPSVSGLYSADNTRNHVIIKRSETMNPFTERSTKCNSHF